RGGLSSGLFKPLGCGVVAAQSPVGSGEAQVWIYVLCQWRGESCAQGKQSNKSDHCGVVGTERRRRELEFDPSAIAFTLNGRTLLRVEANASGNRLAILPPHLRRAQCLVDEHVDHCALK